MKNYFIVHHKDGTILDFNKQCDLVDYCDPIYCVFSHKYEDNYDGSSIVSIKSGEKCIIIPKNNEVIAINPHDSILFIENIIQESN